MPPHKFHYSQLSLLTFHLSHRKTAVTLSAYTPRSGLPDLVLKSLLQYFPFFLLSSFSCAVRCCGVSATIVGAYSPYNNNNYHQSHSFYKLKNNVYLQLKNLE
ncbi:MAG: hypothetical protein PHQ33_08065, partial [Bacteroidales bacterium]|nr:hypothetical protein [Bacteroidales bacterium]